MTVKRPAKYPPTIYTDTREENIAAGLYRKIQAAAKATRTTPSKGKK